MKKIKSMLVIPQVLLLLVLVSSCKGGNAMSNTNTVENTVQTTLSKLSPTLLTDPQKEPDWWDGFDFGQNLGYAEEYSYQSDPGEYLNPAEAAKFTFDSVTDNGNVPEYKDSTEYMMIFIDITDIEGEECYVYRLDVNETTGTIGAAYAFAYQSGNIYMQGFGGNWIQPEGL